MCCKLVICIIWLTCFIKNGQFTTIEDKDEENDVIIQFYIDGPDDTERDTYIKPITGIKLYPNTIQRACYHEDTIALFEFDPQGSILRNCEIIEIMNEEHGENVMKQLEVFLGNKPKHVTFSEITDLMDDCQLLDENGSISSMVKQKYEESSQCQEGKKRTITEKYLKGIVPGTKWCGPGDIADTYFDLGVIKEMDMCCRTHDLCPVKILPGDTKYSLKNETNKTRSHCHCDDMFSSCLMQIDTIVTDMVGNIYFNKAKIECIEDSPNGEKQFREPKSYDTKYRSLKKSLDKLLKKSVKKPLDKSSDKSISKSLDQFLNKFKDKSLNNSMKKSSVKSLSNSKNKSLDKSLSNSENKSSDKSLSNSKDKLTACCPLFP